MPSFTVDQVIENIPHKTFSMHFQLSRVVDKFIKQFDPSSKPSNSNSKSNHNHYGAEYGEKVWRLADMGFDPLIAKTALEICDQSSERALQMLLDKPEIVAQQLGKTGSAFNSLDSSFVAPDTNNFFIYLAAYVQQRIANCGNYCPVCDAKLEYGAIKPIICASEDCKWKYEELGCGINLENEVKNNPHVVDVLVSMACCSATSQDRRDEIWNPFPSDFYVNGQKDYNLLVRVLNLIPPVWQMAQAPNLMKLLAKPSKQQPHATR